MRDTRQTLAEWNRNPWSVLKAWVAGALAVAVGLLVAVWVIAAFSPSDPTPLTLPGLNRPADVHDVLAVLFRNSLVLAPHAFACVPGLHRRVLSPAHRSATAGR
jgi:hypothetical protein